MGYYYYRMPASQRVAAMGGASYLLDDEFSDTRAAGAVNGTPCTPGPGTRVVVDTALALSIGSGVATINGTLANWFDPTLAITPLLSRVVGQMMVISTTIAANTRYCYVWSNTANPAGYSAWRYGIVIYAGNIRAFAVGGISMDQPVGLASAGVGYKFAIVHALVGCYLFVQGGAYTTWTLLYRVPFDTTTPMCPLLSVRENSQAVDFLRVPSACWLPTPLACDTFTRANGVLGNSEAIGPDGQVCTARAWTANVGTWAIAANVATCSVLAGGIGIATVETNTVSTFISAVLTRAGNEVGVVLRYVDADNYVRAIHDGTNCKLIKRVAAVETTVISAAAALGAGRIIVISDGTSFSLYLNNVQIGTTQTISDAALQTGTGHGLYTTNVGNTFDALLIFPRGSNGEYADLDRWSGEKP